VEEMRNAYKVLAGKPERMSPGAVDVTWGPRRRWEDNIKIDVKEIHEGVDWIQLF
jgi:hypothetical protein